MYICIIYYIYIINIFFKTGYTLYSPGWSITDCVAKTILKLTVILLLHVPESQVYRCVPLPCLTQTGFFFSKCHFSSWSCRTVSNGVFSEPKLRGLHCLGDNGAEKGARSPTSDECWEAEQIPALSASVSSTSGFQGVNFNRPKSSRTAVSNLRDKATPPTSTH